MKVRVSSAGHDITLHAYPDARVRAMMSDATLKYVVESNGSIIHEGDDFHTAEAAYLAECAAYHGENEPQDGPFIIGKHKLEHGRVIEL